MHWKITTVGVLVSAAAAAGMLVDHVAVERAAADQRKAESRQYAANLLPDRPSQFPHLMTEGLATDRGTYIFMCFLFDEQATAQFAAARGASSCVDGMRGLAAEIRPGYARQYTEYLQVSSAAVTIAPDGQTATVDACHLTWSLPLIGKSLPLPSDGAPGPQLGHLSLRQEAGTNGGGMRITAYRPCEPATTPPGSAPTAPGTTSTRPPVPVPTRDPAAPALLPSYAGGYAATLAARIADDRSPCGLFSPTGAKAFAAAHGAPDCVTAMARLAAKVTDARRYRSPRGSTVQKNADSQPVVFACHLDWPVLGPPVPPPGPQLGTLVLGQPSGVTAGYWIVDYQPCR